LREKNDQKNYDGSNPKHSDAERATFSAMTVYAFPQFQGLGSRDVGSTDFDE
jgi:hypothetical protein